jgi:hypothetical protein
MYGGNDRRGTRKPLVIFTPKSLLRHAEAVSALREFTHGHFAELLSDAAIAPDRATKVIFCSGKIYYELLAERRKQGLEDAALVRLEQIYPWPADQIEDLLWRYPSTAEVVWCQEEPRNMGAFLSARCATPAGPRPPRPPPAAARATNRNRPPSSPTPSRAAPSWPGATASCPKNASSPRTCSSRASDCLERAPGGRQADSLHLSNVIKSVSDGQGGRHVDLLCAISTRP